MKVKKQTPETILKNQAKDYLTLHDWFHFPYPAGVMGHKGACDRIAIKNRVVLFLEFKSKQGILSDKQIKFQEDITSHGGIYLVVRSIEELELWTKQIYEIISQASQTFSN